MLGASPHGKISGHVFNTRVRIEVVRYTKTISGVVTWGIEEQRSTLAKIN